MSGDINKSRDFAPSDVPIREFEFEYDLRKVRYILAAAEHSSFRRAAAVLSTRPSSVSRSVRAIEDQLGVSLFDRGTFGVRLTEAGYRFVSRVQPALHQVRFAMLAAEGAGRGEVGVVRVGVVSAISGRLFCMLLSTFRAENPNVRIEINNGVRSDLLRAIYTKELDVALFPGRDSVLGCESLELWKERLHLALPNSHRFCQTESLDWPDLSNERFILSLHKSAPDLHHYVIRGCSAYGFTPRIEFRQVFPEMLMNIVRLGEGISVVTEAWTDIVFPDVHMVPLGRAHDCVPVSAVWSPSTDNPILRRFLSKARELVSQRQRTGDPRVVP